MVAVVDLIRRATSLRSHRPASVHLPKAHRCRGVQAGPALRRGGVVACEGPLGVPRRWVSGSPSRRARASLSGRVLVCFLPQ